ncbi:3-hydroxyacyl-CoA dehydrogenase, NAD binding domain-containing protein [Ditylenchus destructor]|nr:3-hydroxyacyl-CoA dehydrogenase, NAD binding domain-containing protein [Ditylenchus destructor]
MDWKQDLYKKIAPFVAPHAIVASKHLRPVDHQAVGSAAGVDQAALLRHPLLQPAPLHVLVELINTPTTNPEVIDQLESFVTTAVGKGRRARQRHAQLRGQPHRHRRHDGHDDRGREVRPVRGTSSTTSRARSWAARARPPTAPPTWSAWTPWPTSSRPCRTT